MQVGKIDNSLMERRGILELIGRLKESTISLHEMEQLGQKLRQAGRRALDPLLRELWRERSGELITKYAYLLDFFETESWLDQLIQIALKRRDLGEDGKAALLIALEGYGIDVHSAPFKGEFSGIGNPLSQAMHGALRLGEDGVVSFLDDFLSYPHDVQLAVIRKLPDAADPQAVRILEAVLWHEEGELVRGAIEALGRLRDPLAAGVLARFLKDGSPHYFNLALRSLRRLSFLGIQAASAAASLPFHAGYATPPDGDGYRSLLISRWVGEGRLAVLYMQVHERRGLLAAWGAGDLDEEGFQSELEGFSVQDDLYRVDPLFVVELLRDALFWSQELCYLPADFYMRRGMFAGLDLSPAEYHPSFDGYPRQRGLSFAEGEDICRELFADPFFSGWFLAGESVQGFAEEYRTGAGNEAVLERFCAELITPEIGLIRERLLKSADLLRRCGRDGGMVGRVVALAESLKENPLPHHQHPFLRRLAIESMEIAHDAMTGYEQHDLPAAEKR